MRRIEWTTAFKRDYRREKKGQLGKKLDGLLGAVVSALAADQLLADVNKDHPLRGAWKDHRDCHVKGDLVLIYRKPDAATLQLVRLGSHSELFP